MVGGASYDPDSSPSVHEAVRRSAHARGYARALLAALAIVSLYGTSALSASADTAEEYFWDAVKDSKTAAPFKVYLQQYPNSAHSADAEERIKEFSAPPAQPPQEQSLALPPPMPAPPPAPKAPPQVSPAPQPTPEQQAKAIHATFYAKPKAVLRDAPASDAKIRRRLYVREILKVDLESEDGQWYHVGGARGGWVDVASTVDAKTAEAEAWTQAAHSSRVEDLKAYLKEFPKGGHVKEAKEKLAAAEADAEAPSDAQDHQAEGQGATPEEREALVSVTKMLRDENNPAPQAPHEFTANPDSAGGTPPRADAPAAPADVPAEGSSQEARLEPGQGSQAAIPTLPHGNAMEQYNAALGMLAGGQFKAGEEGLKSIITEFPSDPIIASVRYRLGDVYFNQQDYEHALKELQLAYNLKPSSPDAPLALYEMAVSKGYRGETQEACSQLQAVSGKYRGTVEFMDERIREWQRTFKCAR
jgi:TolA-binding protein